MSINRMITLAVAEKLSALETEEYLDARAKRASKSKFLKALSKVSNRRPDEADRM